MRTLFTPESMTNQEIKTEISTFGFGIHADYPGEGFQMYRLTDPEQISVDMTRENVPNRLSDLMIEMELRMTGESEEPQIIGAKPLHEQRNCGCRYVGKGFWSCGHRQRPVPIN